MIVPARDGGKGRGAMAQVECRIELPAEVAARLGETPEAATAYATKAVVLHMLREGRISQGKAAEVLRISRHDMFDLMAEFDIPSGPRTIEELDREMEPAERYLRDPNAARRSGR